MKKKLAVLGVAATSVFAPLLAFAQANPNATCKGVYVGIEAVICKIYSIIQTLIPVLVLAGVLFFVYGVIKFAIAGDAEEKGNARTMMVWGIIGLAVIVGLWGLVGILTNTFGLGAGSAAPNLPVFQ